MDMNRSIMKKSQLFLMTIRYIWMLDKRYFCVFPFSVLFNILMPFPSIYGPKILIDMISKKESKINILVTIIIIVGLIFILKSGLAFISRKMQIIQEGLKIRFHNLIADAAMNISYNNMVKNEMTERMERANAAISGDMNWATNMGIVGDKGIIAITSESQKILADIIKIISFIYILNKLSPIIVVLIIAVVILNACTGAMKNKANLLFRNKISKEAAQTRYCYDAIFNYRNGKEIRLFHMNDFLLNKHKEIWSQFMAIRAKMSRIPEAVDIANTLSTGIQDIVLYIFLIFYSFHKTALLSFVYLYIETAKQFSKDLGNLLYSWLNLDLFLGYMEDFFYVIKEADLKKNEKKCEKEFSFNKEITVEFRNVWFRYDESREYILKDFSIVIKPGEKVALVGRNGAGKTTLIKLLCRLYTPESGKILFNGTDISNISSEAYKEIVSVVFQDFEIFNLSVEENIFFETKNEKQLYKTLEQLNLLAIIDSLPEGKKTILGKGLYEGGVSLSKGQEQRIALARAICKDSKILILDEPTASLDPLSEYHFYMELSHIVNGQTAIFISHRLSSCFFCDRIIVLENGSILEEGKHEALMKRKGRYYEMFREQSKYYKENL